MRFYNATRFVLPRHYSLRVFLVCFLSVHVPLIVYVGAEALLGEWHWHLFLPLLVATVAGSALGIAGLAGLLAPVRLATAHLHALKDGPLPVEVEQGGPDLIGQLLESVAHAAAATAARIDRLRGVAGTDALTGVRNRRGFNEELQARLRNGARGALAILDGDRFKQVNDLLGHARGDDLLVGMANRIRDQVSTQDVVGRWGGDEFIIFFEGAETERASEILESIRTAMIRHRHAEVDGAPIGFSYGVADLEGAGLRSFEQALTAADEELYMRKQLRRTVA